MMINGTKMKKNGKLFLSFLLVIISLGLMSCSIVSPTFSSNELSNHLNESTLSYNELINHQPVIILSEYEDSKFSQVNASFYVSSNKNDAFRIISDLSLSTQWFDRLKSIDTLVFEDNNNFVLRTIISSPWPFKNRELITCVNTQFMDASTIITIENCPTKHPETTELVRIQHANSLWTITSIPNNQQLSSGKYLTKISYQAWLEPDGYVPAFFFNQSLKDSSLKSLIALKQLIENT